MAMISGPSYSAYTWGQQSGGAYTSGGGFGNQTVVDRVLPEMLHMVDPHW